MGDSRAETENRHTFEVQAPPFLRIVCSCISSLGCWCEEDDIPTPHTQVLFRRMFEMMDPDRASRLQLRVAIQAMGHFCMPIKRFLGPEKLMTLLTQLLKFPQHLFSRCDVPTPLIDLHVSRHPKGDLFLLSLG